MLAGGQPTARGERAHSAERAPLVTGLGAVTPFGWSVQALMDGVYAGEHAFTPLAVFDPAGQRTSLAGQVPAMEPKRLADWKPKARARLARTDRFAVAAAEEALAQAGLDARTRARVGARLGVFFASSTGAMLEGEAFYAAMHAAPGSAFPASRLATHQNNGPGDTLSRVFGAGGPLVTFATACAASTMALEAAWLALVEGELDVAIAGGSDGLCRLTYAGFNSLRAVSAEPCRPFRAERDGLSLGEGAGVLVLERSEHAAARGARGLARLTGAASSCDAHHMTAPEPAGDGVRRAMERALATAGLDADAIDFVNAHGTGTPHNDAAEACALHAVFGARAPRVPVTSTKGAIGHLLGSAGAVEAIVTIRSLLDARVPSTPGHGALDAGKPLDVVCERARPLPAARRALSTNLAFGGANAALVFERVDAEEGAAR